MNNRQKFLFASLLGFVALSAGALPAVAATSLGTASTFAVLSAAPLNGGAVTCTDSTIIGDIGSSGAMASVVRTRCPRASVIAPVSAQVLTDFNGAYDALAGQICDQTLTGTLAGVTLAPGVYCFPAAATLTGTLTLAGSSTDTWIFKVGTSGTGALTGTNFSVVMAGGAVACNVYWWVHDAVEMTTSNFKGTILAGAAITVTGGTFDGRALAKAAVTLTNETFVGCQGGSVGGGGDETCDRDADRDDGRHVGRRGDNDEGHDRDHGKHCGKVKKSCNQGVGNGPEACDPGNSNQGFPFRSNDEIRGTSGSPGTPGNPGRKGGNK